MSSQNDRLPELENPAERAEEREIRCQPNPVK
jgi:hypothetical protein